MSISALTALTLLVIIAAGFHLGRRRAVRAAQQAPDGQGAGLHSLPNYYGYHIAIWTGLPALGVLALFALGGDMLVKGVTLVSLEKAGAPALAAYERELAADEIYATASAQARELRAEIDQMTLEINRLRSAEADRREPERLAGLIADRDGLADRLIEAETAQAGREEALTRSVMATLPEDADGLRTRAGFEYVRSPVERRDLFLLDARRIAEGGVPSRDTPELQAAAEFIAPLQRLVKFSAAGGALALGLAGLVFTLRQVRQDFRAREKVEGLLTALLWLCSVIAILTTLGIIASLLVESLRFFAQISVLDFLFGLQWSPQIAIREDQIGQTGAFGAVPLFTGTALITVIALLVAAPIGLFSAIFLSEYASDRFREIAKPVLEILAGVPTVVYGFFALKTIGPAIRSGAEWLGFDNVATTSALSAGIVMGVMIIPFVSSLSDDVIRAVPRSLRDGSFAMGATRSETVTRVVLPAALPGVVGALLLAVSRAVGETMIVVMAAGQGANLTLNPLESVTTITVQIVSLLTGDLEFDSVKTLSAFALGLVLFLITLALNIIALRVVQTYREKYE